MLNKGRMPIDERVIIRGIVLIVFFGFIWPSIQNSLNKCDEKLKACEDAKSILDTENKNLKSTIEGLQNIH